MAPLEDYLSSGPDPTVYYDFADASDVANHPADATGVEENEVEDILTTLSGPMKKEPSLLITQMTPPATPAASRVHTSSPSPVETEESQATTTTHPSPSGSQTPSPTIPSTPVTTNPHPASSAPVLSLFPHLARDEIVSVITHDMHAEDLYRLGARQKSGDASDGTTADYSTFDSLYIPLLNYFSILSIYLSDDYSVPLVFFSFLAHLQDISSQYEWPAVRDYVFAFFGRRRTEMFESNDYSRWAVQDTDLAETLLLTTKEVRVEESASVSSSSTTVMGDNDHNHVPLPERLDTDNETSQAMPLLIGFFCSLIALTLATIIVLPLSLIRLSYNSTAISDIGIDMQDSKDVDEREEVVFSFE